MSEPLLEARGLAKRFRDVRAVDGVSLAVGEGETLGLVGETGSGKTTAARLMVRLLDPDAGEVRFRGRDVTRARGGALRALRREVGMVFQDPYSSLNPRRTVGSIVGEPFAVHGLHRRAAERRAAVGELLERVGLGPEHLDRFPHEFSGGQRQRIGVARALALSPRLIVADEPVSALDVSIQAQILNLLRDLRRDRGIALVFISHDLSVIRYMADRVAVMTGGRIVEHGDADQVYRAPRHDYTRALLAAVPGLEPRRRGDQPSPSSS